MISIPALVSVSDRYQRGGIDTSGSAPPQRSPLSSLPTFLQRTRHVRANAAPFTSRIPPPPPPLPLLLRSAVVPSRDPAAPRAAVRRGHVLRTTDAVTDHDRGKMLSTAWSFFTPANDYTANCNSCQSVINDCSNH